MSRTSARQRANQRRGSNACTGSGLTCAAVVAVALTAALGLTGGGKDAATVEGPTSGDYALPASAKSEVLSVPVSKLAAVARTRPASSYPPQALPSRNPVLTLGGKPEILYIGAEYCPFCAGERWPLVMALSKFGTFGNLRGTSSSATDRYASTPTFTFYRSTYTSKYLTFVPVELETNTGNPLQRPTPHQVALLTRWDAPPYIPKQDAGEDPIPFVYIGGKYVVTSVQFSYTGGNGMSGWSFAKAASVLTSGSSAMSKGALAAAGYLVGDLCTLTHNQPAEVCSQVPATLKGPR
jgi:hypothetical protein